MADAIRVSGPINAAGNGHVPGDRQVGPAGRRRGARPGRRHHRPEHRRHQQAAGGHRLLPAHRRRRGADVRRGQDPRRRLPSGGSPGRAGHPHLSPHRPSAAAVVPRGIPQRGAGRGDHHGRRPREPARHRSPSTAPRPRSPCRASRSTARSARCACRVRAATGSRTRRSSRAPSPPSSWSSPAA